MDGHLGLFDCQDVNELQPLVPQLEALVQAMGEGQMVRGGGGAAADQPPNVQVAVEEVRVRAARILVRIKGAEAWQWLGREVTRPCEAASLHDLGSLAACGVLVSSVGKWRHRIPVRCHS